MSMLRMFRKALLPALIATTGLTLAAHAQVGSPSNQNFHFHPIPRPPFWRSPQDAIPTATPIKHLVVIFDENRSFDHYFGTYPVATNPPGEPAFRALPFTPAVDGLTTQLLTHNPNVNPQNGVNGVNPFRIDRSQANTEGQNHNYTAEQQAYDNGLADPFPSTRATTRSAAPAHSARRAW